MVTLLISLCLFHGNLTFTGQVAKPLTIQLQDKSYSTAKPYELSSEGSILDGHGATLTRAGAATAIRVGAAGHITIRNVKISGFSTGISISGATDLTLVNVTITNCTTGIQLQKVAGGLVQGLQLHGNEIGIKIAGSSKLIVEKSDLSNNRQYGLILSGCTNNIVRDNRIIATGVAEDDKTQEGAVGISVESGSNTNEILRNVVVHSRSVGIRLSSVDNSPSANNTFDGNDVSWTGSGVGFQISNEPANKVLNTTAGFCRIGISLSHATEITVKGSLVVGCTDAGLFDEEGTKNVYDSNVWVRESGSQVAINLKGTNDVPCGTRLFQNIFEDYVKPISIENVSPLSLQSNIFPKLPSVEIEDVATIVGKRPLALDSQNELPKRADLVASEGPIATIPSVYDRLGGVSVSSSQPGDVEVFVESSLSGYFQGEEEVISTYKGEMPIDIIFPPRFAAQVRVRLKGAKPQWLPFIALLGDNSMAKNKPADDSGDTLFLPGLAVDGDTSPGGQVWKPPHGRSGEWWEVDLKNDQVVNTISIMAPPNQPTSFWQKFHVAISSTGLFKGEETTLFSETSFSKVPGPIRIYTFLPVTGRYIRLYGDVDQEGVQLQQIGVYGLKH